MSSYTPDSADLQAFPPSSSSAHWTREEARLLQSLREAAGVDEAVFAKAHAISLSQLRTLEDRGASPFYSEKIKAQLGRRLLRRLGHEPAVMPAWEPVHAPAAPFVLPSVAPAQAPAPVMTSAQAAIGSSRPQPPAVPPRATGDVDEDDPLDIPVAPRGRARGLAGAAAALIALVGGAWALGALQQRPVTDETAAAPVASGAGRVSVLTDSSAPAAPPAAPPAATAAATPDPAPAPSPARASLPLAGCGPALRGQAQPFTPERALRAATYVHVEATDTVQLCVVDARERITEVELRAGETRSVYGDPPFVVKTSPGSGARVFFQGTRVPLAESGASGALLQAQGAL